MGCLPTYETAGAISIVLLVLCRLVQGLSVGGQLPASLVYTVEKRHPSEWGLYGTLPGKPLCPKQLFDPFRVLVPISTASLPNRMQSFPKFRQQQKNGPMLKLEMIGL